MLWNYAIFVHFEFLCAHETTVWNNFLFTSNIFQFCLWDETDSVGVLAASSFIYLLIEKNVVLITSMKMFWLNSSVGKPGAYIL